MSLVNKIWIFILLATAKSKPLADIGTFQNWDAVYTECITNGTIAFTFDDGPSDLMEKVLDVLKEKGIKATFFVNGNNIMPIENAAETLTRICNDGHEIGSHTWSHIDLIANQSEATIREEMLKLEEKVEEMIGLKMSFMRPPYGNTNDTVITILNDDLNYSIVNWNLDTNDWFNKEDVEMSMDFYRNAMENTTSEESSFISLHHDWVPGSPILARMAIEYALEKGYTPVTVSECLGFPPQNNKCNTDSSTPGGSTPDGSNNGNSLLNLFLPSKILLFSFATLLLFQCI